MTAKEVTISVPAALAEEIDTARQEFVVELLERRLRTLKSNALNMYAQSGISFGAAAHQAGMSQSELARQAYARLGAAFQP